MPAKKVNMPWLVPNKGTFIPMPEFETYDCPRCNYMIPVRHEHADYREMFQGLSEAHQGACEMYEDILKDVSLQFPEVGYYLERKRIEPLLRLKEMYRKSLGDEYGE